MSDRHLKNLSYRAMQTPQLLSASLCQQKAWAQLWRDLHLLPRQLHRHHFHLIRAWICFSHMGRRTGWRRRSRTTSAEVTPSLTRCRKNFRRHHDHDRQVLLMRFWTRRFAQAGDNGLVLQPAVLHPSDATGAWITSCQQCSCTASSS